MKTVIHIKTDPEIKKTAQKTAESLGLSLSAVMNAYLRQFISSKEVHVSAIPRMTPELERLLAGVEKDVRHGRNLSLAFSTAEDIDAYLDAT